MRRTGTTGRLVIGVLAALAVATGCHRNVEPYVEGEQPRAPDLSRIFPESTAPKALAEMGQGTPAPPRTTPAGGRGAPPVAAPRGAAGEAAPITGVVEIAPELAGQVAGGVLFVIARLGPGPPLAVLRVPSPRLPHSFEIGPGDVMIPSMKFEGEIQLTARLDADGNAMTRVAGDLSGEAPGRYRPGASGVVIRLDEKL